MPVPGSQDDGKVEKEEHNNKPPFIEYSYEARRCCHYSTLRTTDMIRYYRLEGIFTDVCPITIK